MTKRKGTLGRRTKGCQTKPTTSEQVSHPTSPISDSNASDAVIHKGLEYPILGENMNDVPGTSTVIAPIYKSNWPVDNNISTQNGIHVGVLSRELPGPSVRHTEIPTIGCNVGAQYGSDNSDDGVEVQNSQRSVVLVPIPYGAPLQEIIGNPSVPQSHVVNSEVEILGNTTTTNSEILPKSNRKRKGGRTTWRPPKRRKSVSTVSSSNSIATPRPPVEVFTDTDFDNNPNPQPVVFSAISNNNIVVPVQLLPESVNVEDVNADDFENLYIPLRRQFIYPPAWIGIDDVLNDIYPHSCGEMNLVCCYCRAKYFRLELNSRGKYVHCCDSGKVSIPPLGPYPQLLDLLEGRHPDSAPVGGAPWSYEKS